MASSKISKADVAAAVAEANEASATAEANAKAMEVTLQTISSIAPGVGEAIGAAFSGPLAPVILLGMAIGQVKKALDDYNAELDKVAKQNAQPMDSGVVGLKKAFDDAAVSAGKYLAALSHAGQDNDPIKTQTDRAKELVQVQLEGQKQIIQALGKTEEARLRANGATSDQIDAARAQTQAQLDGLDQTLTQNKGSASLGNEQSQRNAAKEKLDAAARAANKAEATAKHKFENDQTEMKNLRDQLGLGEQHEDNEVYRSDQKAIADAQEKLKQAQQDEREHTADDPAVREMVEKEVRDAQSDLDVANNVVVQKKKRLAQLENSEQDRAQAVTNASEDASEARSAQFQNAARLRQLPGEISQAKAREAIEEHTRQVTDILNEHGGKLNESLGRLAAEAGKSQKQTLDIVESIIAGHSTFAQRISELEGQIKHANNTHAGG